MIDNVEDKTSEERWRWGRESSRRGEREVMGEKKRGGERGWWEKGERVEVAGVGGREIREKSKR